MPIRYRNKILKKPNKFNASAYQGNAFRNFEQLRSVEEIKLRMPFSLTKESSIKGILQPITVKFFRTYTGSVFVKYLGARSEVSRQVSGYFNDMGLNLELIKQHWNAENNRQASYSELLKIRINMRFKCYSCYICQNIFNIWLFFSFLVILIFKVRNETGWRE